MPRYAQVVLGPAGSGKSTYCSIMVKHGQAMKRSIHVVNLDPAAEYFDYPLIADIRDLIHLDDAMEDEALHFGPNGGLIYCMEYFAQNFDWLETELGDGDDDYILFDCPGQIELYTHLPVMRQFVEQLKHWNFHVCGLFLVDSQFLVDGPKFFAGVMAALSTMVNLEIAFINVMTKLDLLSKKDKKNIDRFLDPDTAILAEEEPDERRLGKRYQKLTTALANLVDDYSLVRFMPLDRGDEDSIDEILLAIDTTLQFGEEDDVRARDINLNPEEDHDDEDDDRVGRGGDDDE